MVIDPFALAKKNEKINDVFLQSSCARMADYKVSDDTEIVYNIAFGFDEENRPFLKGVVSTNLKLFCGLCADYFIMPLSIEFTLYPVTSEAKASSYPTSLETLVINKAQMSLIDVIEEEIILSIPVMIKHPKGSRDCYNKVDFGSMLKVEHGEDNSVLYITTNDKEENEFSKLKDLL